MTQHTILFLAANPCGTTPRALDQEARSIGTELGRAGQRDRFDLVTRWAAEPLDLLRELRALRPTIVHFSGQSGQDGLIFQAADGHGQVVAPAAIAEAFGAAGASVRVVVLSGCYSEATARELIAHVDCVVGTRGADHGDASRSFAVGFYGALGEQESVAAACRHGAAAISLLGLRNAERPLLEVRPGTDADQLFLVAPPVAPTPCYPDAEIQALSERLRDARGRMQRLREAGMPTAAIEQEILELRRRLREGGQLRAGDALSAGRYLLLRQLGRGGFAVVWEAYDQLVGKRVAIKVLHASLASDRQDRERFFRGARAMMQLNHPAVVQVLEPEAEDGGFHYFVMELVPGGNLHDAVLAERLHKEDLLSLMLRICAVLAEAHGKGMVHRDIKPSNILLDEDWTLKLTDFDLVGAPDTTGGTATGPLGTFFYAAPECLHKPQEATAQADVYSLGMTAIFCLSGRDITLPTLKNPERTIRELRCSDAIQQVLLRAVAETPEARFPDAGALASALQDALGDELAVRTHEAAASQAAAYAAVAEEARTARLRRAAGAPAQLREAAASQEAAYAAVAEKARKEKQRRAAGAMAERPAAVGKQAGAYVAVTEAARAARLRREVGAVAQSPAAQPVAISRAEQPAELLSPEVARQRGILKRKSAPVTFWIGVGLIGAALLLKRVDAGERGLMSILWIAIGLIGLITLFAAFDREACVRCDQVLGLIWKSDARALEPVTLALRRALDEAKLKYSDADTPAVWLCPKCRTVATASMRGIERVLQSPSLARLSAGSPESSSNAPGGP